MKNPELKNEIECIKHNVDKPGISVISPDKMEETDGHYGSLLLNEKINLGLPSNIQ